MKKDIQPQYNLAKVTCSTCGEEFELGSTMKEIKIDTCSNCHPFYTGSQSFVQAQGRVERFNRRYNLSKEKASKEETAE
ncbi:MAG TPA: 50S ribosomal protein L31 [Acholeplasmataceae bacterium]|nr:50S ribosomal protein L31 [Acholeplasmataceae bacterium]